MHVQTARMEGVASSAASGQRNAEAVRKLEADLAAAEAHSECQAVEGARSAAAHAVSAAGAFGPCNATSQL